MKLEVGQRLWYVPQCRTNNACEVEVIAVGRKWAYLNHGRRNGRRIDIETLQVDGRGHPSPGRCYSSQAHYENSCKLHKAWRELASSLPYSPPSHISIADIEAIKKIIGG